MGFNDLLKKLFGNKSQRDLKEIEPYIQKIKAISPELEKLSNDELRHRIDMVKQHIQDSVADDRNRERDIEKNRRCSRRIASRSFRRDERDGASIQPK